MSEPVVPAFATPDAPRRRQLRVRRRRFGLWTAFLGLLAPHIWLGAGMGVLGLREVVFPLVSHHATGTIVNKTVYENSKHGHETRITVQFYFEQTTHRETIGVSNGYGELLAKDLVITLNVARFFSFLDVRTARESTQLSWLFFGGVGALLGWIGLWYCSLAKFYTFWLLRRGEVVRADVRRQWSPSRGVQFADVRFKTRLGRPVTRIIEIPLDAPALGSHADVVHHPRWPALCVVVAATPWEIVS